jgi:uncharacterized protein (DUF885 family)
VSLDSWHAVLLPERFRGGCAFGDAGGDTPAAAFSPAMPCDGRSYGTQETCQPPVDAGIFIARIYTDFMNESFAESWHRCGVVALTLLVAVAICMQAQGAEPNAATRKLHELFDAAWEQDLRDDPRAATLYGDHRFDPLWPDYRLEAIASREQRYRKLLRDVESIPAAELSEEDRLNRELFRRLYQDRIDQYRFGAHLRPLDQLNYSQGVLTANEVAEVIDFASRRQYEDWISRLRGMDAYVSQVIELMREGLRTKNVQPRIIMERVMTQLQAQLVDDPTRSPFYAPLTRMPATLSVEDATELRAIAQDVIRSTVVPAFKRLEQFLARDYLPASRASVGIWDTPQGEQFYRNRLEWFTTTKLSADEIHALGLEEVQRIRAEMQRIIDQVGFKGSFEEFLQHLRTAPQFRYRDPDDLLRAYMVMAKKIDPLLPAYFGKLPRTPYGVRPIPAANAPDTTTAYYQPSSSDGKRPGYYYVNLYKPEERPTYEIPVLTMHEAVPGHHLQIALAQELGELPKFRRNLEVTAFVEGWALYAESLGEEMGLYGDPYDKFGQLTYEMWRAVRLVVDTGIHHKRWTREQAIAYFKANAPKSELDIVNEIDRYIAWPGQATAYKVGELQIKNLRRRAREQLGDHFDLREFHDAVLASGAVPLDVLERRLEGWTQAKRQ